MDLVAIFILYFFPTNFHSLVSKSNIYFRYRYVVSPDGTFGTRLPDGSWTGLMGMVVREVSNTTGCGYLMKR